MRKRTSLRSLLLIVLSVSLWTTLRGQVTLYASHEAGEPGETVTVDLRVVDFEAIVSAQFTLLYDSLLLEFVDVGDFGIFNFTNLNFGVPNGTLPTKEGVITFSWIADTIATGHTLPDSALLFSITYKLIGANGQVSPISFPLMPDLPLPPPEFSNPSSMELPYQFYDGSVTIGASATSEEIVTGDFVFSPIAPNPAKEEAVVRFFLQRSSPALIEIFDMTGKPVFEHKERYGNGWQALTLRADRLPAAGTYFVRLTTDNAQAVQTLIVTR